MGRFDGKVAIITGSSSGIGRATAVLFAKEGAKITIAGKDLAAVETGAECIKAGAKESEILVTSGDLMEEKVRKELIDKTLEKFGKLDILVGNHGGALVECKEDGSWNIDTFDPTFNQNTKSTLDLCLKAEPHLKKTKGDIVLVSSAGADMSVTWNPFYAMAKISLCHLTRILGFRLAKDGVRVNCIKPGIIVTPFYAKLGLTPESTDKMAKFHANHSIPMGRTGTWEEIAEPIAFLADRKASGYMTGQSITVDGGAILQHAMSTYSFNDIMKRTDL
uniref:Uncharacterized protein n=1 Tax=Parascaris univalens TaxID=6257 RepID=A0A915CA62_PARUN